MSKLLPCPFCGKTSVCLAQNTPEGAWFVHCGTSREAGDGCGAEGPCYPTKTDARAEWNRRTAPTIAARLDEAVGLLRRAREHIADTSPPAGNCIEPCGHRYCAAIRAANAEREAIVAAADSLLAAIDAEKAREGT